jgi:HAD superfamily phosphatase (TIGR01668 family)
MRMVERFARSLAPDSFVERVTDLRPEALKADGIEGLILDLDNTLCEWQSEVIPEDILHWLQEVQEAGICLCLASNTHNRRRLDRVARALNIPYVRGVPKPRRQCFAKAFLHMNCRPEAVAVAGDQMFTDILGGKRSGIRTIMVRPIHPREFIGTKLSRMLEERLLRWFERHNLLPIVGNGQSK